MVNRYGFAHESPHPQTAARVRRCGFRQRALRANSADRAWRCGSTSRKLQELGYDIESGARGYRLRSSPDGLHPWEFPGREDRMVYLRANVLHHGPGQGPGAQGLPGLHRGGRRPADPGPRPYAARVWSSEEGGLYFTVVLRPRIPVLWSSRVNFLAVAARWPPSCGRATAWPRA
ncbi:MAG: hypothetical protein MZV70_18940 [Desulfobacterales bacterium]|nr:hypothetical protein [Desulfobacterales bacterium]